ncbi:Amino acid ABC transporter substrate-binding protein [Cupriavidus taiwanensis]|uniref:ABC transporter substrate-binding protein n=1 Tax=Cupriavidus taiwanensis TaxID=164546 RepID=UPI000E154AC2|nr:ABC transporter substrate-binding protein [Cupriavidus taiwanensis]SOY93294.1 Amino acid ABC transporter substrate-binding protein [Cupriavidus taiwanensis]SOY96460.1 Amino acid ABC transporter substrate-binding protein [Cupriavidus taiwanensis]
MKATFKLSFAVLTCALAIAAPAKADQLADIKARGTLVCGVLSNLEPFGFQDPNTRELVGYDVDFCKGIAKVLGVKPELKVVSLEARIPELSQGRVDVLAAVLGYTPARAEQITFSDSYFVSEQKLAVKGNSSYKQRDDLAGKRISTIKGSSTQNFLQKTLPTAQLVSYDDAPSAFMALVQSKVDGFGLSETMLRRFIAKAGPAGNIQVITPALGQEAWGLGIKKGEPALEKAVNTALADMEKSGEAQQIFDKWLGAKTMYQMKREFRVQPINKG